jgi:opacity protein-like surface antigen
MSRRAIALAALAAAIVTAPVAAHAQSPLRFGLAAGATFPTGDIGDGFDWGYHVGASITGKPMLSPVGIRGEVMWHSLEASENVDAKLNVLAGIVNAEIGMSGIGVKPYFIGGLGIYRVDIDSDELDALFGESDAQTKFGFNVGAGLDFGLAGFSAFTEARFHSIQTEGSAMNIVPITFGLRF